LKVFATCAIHLSWVFLWVSSYSKCCFDFFELSSIELEQVCIFLRPSTLDQATN
jgi:hypothetical protein